MTASAEDYKAVITRLYHQANDAQRYEVLDEICAPDMVSHDTLTGDAAGREAFKGLLAFFAQAFSEQRTELLHFVVEGDYASVLHVHHALHSGPFNGVAPTGRSVRVPGHELFRLDPASGRIVEFWRFDADLSLMLQLGAAPAPAAA